MKRQMLYRLGSLLALGGALGLLWSGTEPQFVLLLIATAPSAREFLPPAYAAIGPGWQPGLTSLAATYGIVLATGWGMIHAGTMQQVHSSLLARRGRLVHGVMGMLVLAAAIGLTWGVISGLQLFGEVTTQGRYSLGMVTAIARSGTVSVWLLILAGIGLLLNGFTGFESCRRPDYPEKLSDFGQCVFYAGIAMVALIPLAMLLSSMALIHFVDQLKSATQGVNPVDVAMNVRGVLILSGFAALSIGGFGVCQIAAAFTSPGLPNPGWNEDTDSTDPQQ